MYRFSILFLIVLLITGCSQNLQRVDREPSPKVIQTAAPQPIYQAPVAESLPPISRMTQEIAFADAPFKKRSKEKGVVVLDAGHGGEDFGTHSLGTPKYQEKYLNMSTTQLVKGYLEQAGYKVIMTRSDDTFISLDKRALFANEQKPDLFVSIHYNSAPSREAEGIEVFYYRNEEDKTRSNKSKQLAQAILDKTINNTKAKSRGVKHGNLAVLRGTDMPAVLIEGGFLTSAAEMEKIKDASYLKNIALGISQGVQDFLSKQTLAAN